MKSKFNESSATKAEYDENLMQFEEFDQNKSYDSINTANLDEISI